MSSVTADVPIHSTTPTSRSVLVVEDEPHIRELVVLHLGLEGLEVVEARDGEEAIRLIRSRVFDLCVLDLMLPRASSRTLEYSNRSVRHQTL
jgi:DNA-binding response OmpR family regulator